MYVSAMKVPACFMFCFDSRICHKILLGGCIIMLDLYIIFTGHTYVITGERFYIYWISVLF